MLNNVINFTFAVLYQDIKCGLHRYQKQTRFLATGVCMSQGFNKGATTLILVSSILKMRVWLWQYSCLHSDVVNLTTNTGYFLYPF